MSPETGEQPRRRIPAEARRKKILGAALEVFAARGYRAASIDEIAQAAGVSKALIYEHFPSKRDIHVSLIEANALELFERLVGPSTSDEPGEDRLRAGVDACLRFVEERRDGWRMLFRDAAEADVAGVLERFQSEATRTVARSIAHEPIRARPDDRDPELAIELMAQMLTGAVQSLANWWLDHPEVPRRELVEEAMNFAWLGLERLRAGERAGD